MRGYDLTVNGATLDVTLHWQSTDRTDQELIVFVHLLDSDGNLIAQHDSIPNNGLSPTWQWLADQQYQRDPHQLQLPEAGMPTEYSIYIGVYDSVTGVRKTVTQIGHDTVLDQLLLKSE